MSFYEFCVKWGSCLQQKFNSQLAEQIKWGVLNPSRWEKMPWQCKTGWKLCFWGQRHSELWQSWSNWCHCRSWSCGFWSWWDLLSHSCGVTGKSNVREREEMGFLCRTFKGGQSCQRGLSLVPWVLLSTRECSFAPGLQDERWNASQLSRFSLQSAWCWGGKCLQKRRQKKVWSVN